MEEQMISNSSIQHHYCSTRIVSSETEIVEISEEITSSANTRDVGFNDVYVAVGKHDLHVLKWALDHALSPPSRLFLVHVFPPLSYISTPVGRLSKSQLSQDQVRYYINEEHERRRNLLQKYIKLCNDSKVNVETMLLESKNTAKAILDLIPVLNITNFVMGTTWSPRHSRLFQKKFGKAEFVRKNAPEYCKVSIVDDGRKSVEVEQPTTDIDHNSRRRFLMCICFPGKFNAQKV
ncbi:U-box domain-containing protein 54-like [Euphorbia lathyris]|uniref:U-box domain-containing protein 54-like n=1 Tax=Euphorbia lathyris TaxID=212925 RepID=UPI0033140B2F